MKTIAALLLMCDARDLSLAFTEHVNREGGVWEPDLFLYDNYPGGIGHSQPLFKLKQQLLKGALDLVRSCPCDAGCPSCVGPLGEVGERGKESAVELLFRLQGSSKSTQTQTFLLLSKRDHRVDPGCAAGRQPGRTDGRDA